MQHTLALIIVSFLLFLLFAGAFSPLWIRREQTRILHTKIFSWLTICGGTILVGIIIESGFSEYLSSRAEVRILLILAVFTIIAIVIGGNVLYELYIKRHMETLEARKLRQRYPDSPWRWSKRWRTNRIDYSDTKEMIVSYLVAAVIITVIPLVFILNTEAILKRFYENRMDSLVILYILVMGIIFSVRFAVNATFRWRKFKRSSFEMSTVPGVIGEMLEGEIQTWTKRVPCEGFDVKLSCVEMDITFQKSFHSITETVLWKSEKRVRIEDIHMGPWGISVPVSFAIPLTAEETDTISRDRRIHWILTVRGTGEEQCLDAAFKVPVFRKQDRIEQKPTSSAN